MMLVKYASVQFIETIDDLSRKRYIGKLRKQLIQRRLLDCESPINCLYLNGIQVSHLLRRKHQVYMLALVGHFNESVGLGPKQFQ